MHTYPFLQIRYFRKCQLRKSTSFRHISRTPTRLNRKGYTTLFTTTTQNIVYVVYPKSTQAHFIPRAPTWLKEKGYTTGITFNCHNWSKNSFFFFLFDYWSVLSVSFEVGGWESKVDSCGIKRRRRDPLRGSGSLFPLKILKSTNLEMHFSISHG